MGDVESEIDGSIQGQHLLITTLRKYPALLFSFTYVVASSIGMFFSWDYLRKFGIDVFDYAQLSDFLLASLKEPYTWLIAIVTVLSVVLDLATSHRVAARAKSRWIRWYGHPKYRFVSFLIAIPMLAVFLDVYATRLADKTFEGKGKIVAVKTSAEASANSLLLLGTTGQFVFLFDADSRQVTIHPNESIYSISFAVPDSTNSKSKVED